MPCSNNEVRKAAIFSLNTALRWCDVSVLRWENIKRGSIQVQQSKTKRYMNIMLTSDALAILGKPKSEGKVFKLPTQDGANKVLKKWVRDAGINKSITWHCLRHTFSTLLQDLGAPVQHIANEMGHSRQALVQKTYQHGNAKILKASLDKFPSFTRPVQLVNTIINGAVGQSAEVKLKLIEKLEMLGFTAEEIKIELGKLK